MKTPNYNRIHQNQQGAVTAKSLLILIAALILVPLLVVGFYEGRKAYWDAQVREMCAKDGGIKVYETVTLSAVEYDKYAKRNWILPSSEEAKSTAPYYCVSTIHFYREGNPQMSRRQYSVVRRSDGKILGEMITYGRGGGDFPGPWHGSSFHCPDLAKLPGFETSIFIKGN